MKTLITKISSLLFLGMFVSVPVLAQDLIAVAKDGNVYDEASAKYITLNQDNEDVCVIPGMVFETSQHTPGWYKVEYSPGLHAFIPDQIIANNFNTIVPGTYDIQNYAGHKITAQLSGDEWTATVDGNNLKGKKVEDIIIFLDSTNKIAYSIVDLGDGPIAITYDNSVTKFF